MQVNEHAAQTQRLTKMRDERVTVSRLKVCLGARLKNSSIQQNTSQAPPKIFLQSEVISTSILSLVAMILACLFVRFLVGSLMFGRAHRTP